MNKYKLLISIFNLYFGSGIHGQDTQIRILDSRTNQPIPYTTIRSNDFKSGTYANTEGVCTLTEHFKDSLYISSIGYHSKKISRRDIKDNVIYLDEQIPELTQVIVSPRKSVEEATLGIVDAKKNIIWTSGGYGDEFAQKIIFPDTTKIYKIKTITIGAERFDPVIPMILHIYDTNPEGGPGNDILLKKIVLSKDNFKKSKRKLVIDISSENIFINAPDCFVGIEWLPVPQQGQRLPTTAIILTNDLSTPLTYSRAFFWNKEWTFAPTYRGDVKPNNTVISVKVDVLE